MNRSTLNILCVASFALVAASCSSGGGSPGTTPVAGQSSPAGNTSVAGTSGAGGATSVGGATVQDTGGSTVAQTGGSTETGGSPGGTIAIETGGVADTGGVTTPAAGTSASSTAKTGGTTSPGGTTSATTAGGTTSSGGATTAGGTTAKTGGATSSGGATTAGGTTAKTGGATSSGGVTSSTGAGGGMSVNPADVVPDLVGFYWEDSCQGNFNPGGHNCWTDSQSTTCPSGGIDMDKTFTVKGTAGQLYTVNIEVRGVVGTRCYQGGTRPSTDSATIQDSGYNAWWYAGGTPYNATSLWNTYELHVSPSTGDPSKDVYYFNSASSTLTSGGDCEREASYLVKYTASFKVMGGGSLLFRVHDNNCKAQQNCGPNTDPNSSCAARTVDLSGMTPQPPATSPASPAKQPPTNAFTKTYYPQWMWITATSVTSS